MPDKGVTPSAIPLDEEARSMTESGDNHIDRRLHLRFASRDPAVVVQVAGEVDMATVVTLRAELRVALSTAVPPAPIVVDLTETAFLGSVGLNELLSLHQHAAQRDTPLRIVATRRPVLRAIKVAGLDTILTVCEDLDHALRS